MRALHDRLEDLAAAAPAGEALPGDLWVRGVRRARARRAGTAAAVAAVLAVLIGTTSLIGVDREPQPADAPSQDLHLPEVVHTPGTWSDEEGPNGPVAALGLAIRTRPDGLTGEGRTVELFGVSAVDGRSRWIDLPGVDTEGRPLVDWFALSPDGRWIGWSRHGAPRDPGGPERLVGWAVMDTTTGVVRELADPEAPVLRETASELAFSGDSRYLLTSYERPGAPRTRGHRFVAWDVRDGSRTVLEEPGAHWLPSLGAAPSGVVWSRGSTVHRADPGTGARSSYSLPRHVVTASWGPDETAFAYIGREAGRSKAPWRLYAGRSMAEARERPLRLPTQPGRLLGWRDERHVVVDHYRRSVHVVDVVTGDVVEHSFAGKGEPMNPAMLAADLWQNPFETPADPEGASDPRRPWRWAGGAVLGLAAVALALWRRTRA